MNNALNSDFGREAEKSAIVANWLHRLQECLPGELQQHYAAGLRYAGLPANALDSPQILSQTHLDATLLKIRQNVPDITLHLFSRAEITDLGLVGYAAINSGSVGSALNVMFQYHSLTSDRYQDTLEVEGDIARIIPVPLPGYADDLQNIIEDSFSGNWRALQLLLGPDADTGSITLSLAHAQPDYADTYYQLFGPNCHFDRPISEFTFPSAWLKHPVYHGSGALSQVYAGMCERVLGPGDGNSDTAQIVRRLLLTRSGRHMPRLEEAAVQLRMSPGQLRKRLYRAGTTYKKLVLEIRMELAQRYLRDTTLSVQEIAYLLDYATPAPFSRAFKLHCGNAPDHFRTQMQANVSQM
ncbi:AraC family transcriptional regulator [Halieaceae bacterium IMCC8485]|uniref:AraC family transcriptional regulator n=1 Tax=Candidatus Seongchinamella marina TaxID=2518990 RepID=A0ABT3SPZ9_9GAMM|nr:AraC family transcriptional regulator [Candidatus Seongchinamella marina]MCX2972066.1 AraC family transcriptional regulator [Candidatus Seongchinamella marina]